MTDTQNTPTPNITPLTKTLEESLTDPHHNPDTLDTQSQILDQLFMTIMTQNIADRLENPRPYRSDATMEWLAMALKIQKQCVETIKTKGAIDYMNSLTTKTAMPK